MTTSTATVDSSRDFDFLMGHWHIENRRLVQRLQGSHEWETFEATGYACPLPGGIGNYDEFVPSGWRPGYVGMSLRVFNPETKLWSIYWLNNQTGGLDSKTGMLLPPVIGKFKDGIGSFEGTDELHGKPILVRFIWSDISSNHARWEQMFSPDNGNTWETNWIMLFTRTAD